MTPEKWNSGTKREAVARQRLGRDEYTDNNRRIVEQEFAMRSMSVQRKLID
jgi:hypothetical protein